jgi:hypothetical protein
MAGLDTATAAVALAERVAQPAAGRWTPVASASPVVFVLSEIRWSAVPELGDESLQRSGKETSIG